MFKFTTTFKFEGYCSTFAKYPLLNCMHAATACIPVFLIPMAASILPQVTN